MPGQHVAVVINGQVQWTGTLIGIDGPWACIQDDEQPRRKDEVRAELVVLSKDAPKRDEAQQ